VGKKFVAVYGHGIKRKARIKNFVALKPVTVAPVKAAQIVRDDLYWCNSKSV